MRLAFAFIVALLPTVTSAAVPQSPIAAGSLSSVLEVVTAANECRVQQLRLDTREKEARLYLDEMPTPDALGCLEHWLTSNGKRLKLQPRWWKDGFTQDKP